MAKEPRRVTDPYPLFTVVVKRLGAPAPVRELQFDPSRKFRFDYAWPDLMLAVEVDGGVFTGGRHTRGAGFLRDMQKQNLAVRNGWAVLRYTPDQLLSVGSTEVVEFIKKRSLGSGQTTTGEDSCRTESSGRRCSTATGITT